MSTSSSKPLGAAPVAQRLFALLAGLGGLHAQQPTATTKPPHLAVDVDATQTAALEVTFDQDMDTSVHAVCGGGSTFPKVLATRWRDAKTFVLEVELQPERVYLMDLACPNSSGFRTARGVALPTTPWRFATRGTALADGVGEATGNRLFAALRDHYSYRDRLGVDWAELEREQAAELANAPSAAALALRVATLLGAAQDPHITVRWGDSLLPTYQRAVAGNFDMRGLQKQMPALRRVGRLGLWGRTDDGVGYLLVPSFARELRDEFDLWLACLTKAKDCKALVLDLRTNGGGDEALAARLAGFFVRGERVYAAHRLRDPAAERGFRDVQERTVRANAEPEVFDGPVAVLMGPHNMSSAEAFLLMMQQAPNAVLVGARSFGSSGNPRAHALNQGLTVLLPSWQALRADHTCFEGEGIAPHLPVATTPEQFVAGDPVLVEALARLRVKH
ncbi:MAG: S41 family peptidase [Planctomycetes bacterium]|nr:S41 family peptidase [Planctomycetota bacterium]